MDSYVLSKISAKPHGNISNLPSVNELKIIKSIKCSGALYYLLLKQIVTTSK